MQGKAAAPLPSCPWAHEPWLPLPPTALPADVQVREWRVGLLSAVGLAAEHPRPRHTADAPAPPPRRPRPPPVSLAGRPSGRAATWSATCALRLRRASLSTSRWGCWVGVLGCGLLYGRAWVWAHAPERMCASSVCPPELLQPYLHYPHYTRPPPLLPTGPPVLQRLQTALCRRTGGCAAVARHAGCAWARDAMR